MKNQNYKQNKNSGSKPMEVQSKAKRASKQRKGGGNPDKGRPSNRREQATKDSTSERINLDNVQVGKLMRLLKADNDATWYTRNPELLKAATQLPFATITGAANKVTTRLTPGIMGIDFGVAFGSDSDYPTAINQAGKSIYSYLVHANSRNYTYEYQDLMILIIAGAQVFAAIAAGERVYGLAKYYIEQNRYIPDDVIKACGFDPDNIRQNLGQMWFGMNELIARTNQIWIPNTFPVIQRWMWLNSNVYVDSPDARAQMYVFKQQSFLTYDPLLTQEGGGLKEIQVVGDIESSLQSWNGYYNAVSTMINNLISDEDRGVIFGDILNAYGAERVYARPPFTSDYMVTPVFSQEVLTQIENLTFGTSSMRVVGLAQDTEGLKPVWRKADAGVSLTDLNVFPAAAVLNFHAPTAPTSENIAVATRLQVLGTEHTTAWVLDGSGITKGTTNRPMCCGTEIVSIVRLYNSYIDGNVRKTFVEDLVSANNGQAGDPTYKYTVNGDVMAFDWHPFIYVFMPDDFTSQSAPIPITGFGDYDNYIWITMPEAQKIHDTCVYSLFGLPIL